METVKKDNICYAVVHRKEQWKQGLDFLTDNEAFCQVGTWLYQKGAKPRAHRHIHNERMTTLTQECVIVVTGLMRVDLYDESDDIFHSEILKSGDLMIMLAGGHGYEILENNTRIIECKNGPFVSVEKDKKLITPAESKRSACTGISVG
jgi:hypothetical protein